ncbi:hypothetical protein BSKO_02793 [Bryopsis sp. KO-2023]|nr:hypothetical protein BSKO_02793 [Bryopsis sp. KO-2023]
MSDTTAVEKEKRSLPTNFVVLRRKTRLVSATANCVPKAPSPLEEIYALAKRGGTMRGRVPLRWDLPRDILVDSFRRIPPGSLARSSCVAKSWREATNNEPSLKKKIGLERAWLHESIEPTIHKGQKNFKTHCCAKIEDLLALGGWDGFKVFDLKRRGFVYDSEETESLWSISFMDGMLLTGSGRGDLCGWNISTWEKVFCISIFDSYIGSIADLGDNLAVGGADGHIHIRRKGSWEIQNSLHAHEDDITCLLAKEGNLLISGSIDDSIRMWDLADNACPLVISGQKWGVSSMDVSDGLIYCGALDGNVRSWEIESGELVQTFTGHTEIVVSVVVKEGRMFTGSADGSIKIWDAIKGKCVRSFDSPHGTGEIAENGVWVDDEHMVVVRANGEIWEWDFSEGL